MQFEIHTLECMSNNQSFVMEAPQQLSSFKIIWVKNGTGSITIDMQKHAISENVIYCLSPGQVCLFQASGSLKGYHMSLSTEFLYLAHRQADLSFLTAQYNAGSDSQIIRLDEEMQKELEDIVLKMIKEFSSYTPLKLEILKGLFHIFIIYLSRRPDVKLNDDILDRDKEMVRKFMDLLRKNYATKKMVADYANELCVSPNYLNRIVKKISGFTASHHIQQLIVLEAKRQAIYSGLSMKEVAYFLGFNDYAHFSKFFKNNSGMNFTHFKKGLQYNV